MTSDEEPEAMSLIQQRMRLDRARTAAICTLVGAVFLTAGSVWTLVSEGADAPWWRWGFAITFVVLGVFAVVRVIGAVRRLRRFTTEHGPDAGRQNPVGRP
ncbi:MULTISPECIES: hypothetical protein [Microbacterium]|uniref:hypothetical protein n=1 Tax=Microbacterium TaxID=33882 RepID=UPI00278B2B7D|nr:MULTISPECIES: hypothetical protein [Microbacterium]MDQ1115902.1 apolipoprotein N-acyltransferase [Microbacterium testaceum]